MLQDVFLSLMLLISQAEGRLEKTCLALNVYHEARGESLSGQQLVAYVTMARARENLPEFGGPSICNVVFHRNMREDGKLIAEFSWTSMTALAKARLKAAPWRTAWSLADEVFDGGGKVPEDLIEARYYLNPKNASPAGLCWFRRNAVPLGITVNHHSFYRRPRSVSEWMEVRSVPADCYGLVGVVGAS